MLVLQLLSLALPCAAGTAQSITVQGRLIDPVSGTPNEDPSADFTFRLFSAASGGSPLWVEGPSTLPLKGGVFETPIGLSVPLSSAVFAGAERYLEIQVEATVLSPRQRLTAVPWAQRAGAAESLEPGSTEYIQTRNSLQAGATFYVSSASVGGQLTAYGELRAAGDLRVDGLLRGVGGTPLTTAFGWLDASAMDPATLVPNASLDNSSVTKLGNASDGPGGLMFLDASGRAKDAQLDPGAVTKQGNTFNAADKLVQLDGSGFVPNYLIDGASVAKRASTGYIPNTLLDSSSVTLMSNAFNGPNNLIRLAGAGLIQNADIDGSSVTKLNTFGFVPNTFLDSSSVTLQANIFNAANRLASLDASATLNLPGSGDLVYSLVTSTSVNVTGTGAKVRESGVDIVPQGAILMRIGTCPPGYSEYTNLRGRLPVGNCSGCTAGSTAGTAFTTDAEGLTHDHTGSIGTGGSGVTGGTLNSADTQDTTNPYLQLTFCSKN